MNVFIYSSSSLAHPHFGVILNSAKEYSDSENDVTLLYCNGILKTCFKNPDGNEAICKVCSLGYNILTESIFDSINVVPLKANDLENSNVYFEYQNLNELKKIVFKDVQIGYSVLSTYISITRNPNPDINSSTKAYFDFLLNEAVKLTNLVCELINNNNIDKIVVYNGRYYENRAFYDLAKKNNIDVEILEVVGGYIPKQKLYKISFSNDLPHGININYNYGELVWNNSKLDIADKINIGSSFFKNKINKIPVYDIVYTNAQIPNKLPTAWNSNNINIVFFNSSEDEFAAIGSEYDILNLYNNQIEAIQNTLIEFSSDDRYRFFLRVHPNLAAINYSNVTDIYSILGRYSNLTIINATDTIDTYELMIKCDKVVVFGSSMGAEAAYWGKPVILLTACMYYNFGFCYIPKSENEYFNLLRTIDLTPKDSLNAIKYSFYLQDRSVLTSEKLQIPIDLLYIKTLLGEIKLVPYLRFLNSNIFFKLIWIFCNKFIVLFYKNKVKIPY
jgi:hypothetical protein